MKTKIILAVSLLIAVTMSFAFAKEKTGAASEQHSHKGHDDDHGDEAGEENHEEDHDHKAKASHEDQEHGHGHGHGEGESAEENSSVGPDKGITAADEHDGIKLSAEAIKNFDLKTIGLAAGSSWEIPVSAVLTSGEEINIYRLRNGFYKRIDFHVLSKNSTHLKIQSKELLKGDAIVINGVGFLRTAEITAFGGAPEGHSH